MPAPPVQPMVIWFGRVGDLILLSALLEILHRRFGSPCHVIGAGAWLGEIYAAHADVARVSCLHRYTAWAFDPTWWRTRRALRAGRAGPVYVCETDLRKLARIRRLLRFSGIEAARCVFLAQTGVDTALPHACKVAPTHRVDAQTDLDTALPHTSKVAPTHWVDRLVSFGRLTPAAFNAADYPWPAPAPRCAASYGVGCGARRERRVARAARLARPHPDTGAARQPAHHAWPPAARLSRGRQGGAARALGGAAAPHPRAAAAGAHRAMRRAARVTAARVSCRGGAAAGGGGGGAAVAAPAGAVCALAQHDLRRHRSRACGGGARPAAGGAVRRALPAAVAAAQPLRLAGVGRRRTAAVHAPRSD